MSSEQVTKETMDASIPYVPMIMYDKLVVEVKDLQDKIKVLEEEKKRNEKLIWNAESFKKTYNFVVTEIREQREKNNRISETHKKLLDENRKLNNDKTELLMKFHKCNIDPITIQLTKDDEDKYWNA